VEGNPRPWARRDRGPRAHRDGGDGGPARARRVEGASPRGGGPAGQAGVARHHRAHPVKTESSPTQTPPAEPVVKPRLRGRFHQVAFIVSIPAGLALVAAGETASARASTAIYAVCLAALLGTSAS